MTRLVTTEGWKILFCLAVSLLFMLFFATAAAAQTTIQDAAKKYGITYPIAELGNCADYNSCLSYCEDPVNHSACVEFAKKKGFHKDDPIHTTTDEFLKKAKDELGCDSIQSCMTFCDTSANFDKCDAFAKKLAAVGGYVDTPDKPEYLKVAKDVLGCDSAASCVRVCDDPANAQKCTDFARQVGLLGGQVTTGPGGCASEATCKSYCSDPNNFSECSKFAPATGAFRGPGGCDNPNSCRSYCEQNPDACRSYAPGSNGAYVPVSCGAGQYFGPGGACTPTEKTQEAGQCAQGGKYWDGDSCHDKAPPGIYPGAGGAFFQPRPEMNNCKTPGECYDYCKANPGKCGGFDPAGSRPGDTYNPSLYYTPGTQVKFDSRPEMGNCDSPGGCYDYCRANPGKCGGFDPKSPRPTDTYIPGTYYTPPADYTYYTPPATYHYVTPVYYTPPPGSNYTTPSYYTPGSYYTPVYYTPSGNYTTPSYYTPNYYSPSYYTPTGNYTTPSYYTPPPGSNYTTPTYSTPTYYTPGNYTYYTPGNYTYYTPGDYSYYSPSYGTPSYSYPTPTNTTYYSPTYGTPSYSYPSPSSYGTPTYGTPSYGTPSYGTPEPYPTPPGVQGAKTTKNVFQIIWDFFFRK